MDKIKELVERVRLTPVEIGDNLDLEVEGSYPCSDGGITMTISVDKLLQFQLSKVLNDPDLAWIDRTIEIPHGAGWRPRIIPLREAIKEAE